MIFRIQNSIILIRINFLVKTIQLHNKIYVEYRDGDHDSYNENIIERFRKKKKKKKIWVDFQNSTE